MFSYVDNCQYLHYVKSGTVGKSIALNVSGELLFRNASEALRAQFLGVRCVEGRLCETLRVPRDYSQLLVSSFSCVVLLNRLCHNIWNRI